MSIPEGTTDIYGAAFSGCESLRTVELPASLAGPLGGSDGLAYNGCDDFDIIFEPSVTSLSAFIPAHNTQNPMLYFELRTQS